MHHPSKVVHGIKTLFLFRAQNPNRFFPVEEGLGFCIFFGYEYYRNGVKRRSESHNKAKKPFPSVS